MKEKKANKLLQLFFKLFKMDGIAFNGTAHYKEDPENTLLEDRLHEAYHLYEQQRDGLIWYVVYFLRLIIGYQSHLDEIEARAWARQKVAEKNLDLHAIRMTETQYVNYCFDVLSK